MYGIVCEHRISFKVLMDSFAAIVHLIHEDDYIMTLLFSLGMYMIHRLCN